MIYLSSLEPDTKARRCELFHCSCHTHILFVANVSKSFIVLGLNVAREKALHFAWPSRAEAQTWNIQFGCALGQGAGAGAESLPGGGRAAPARALGSLESRHFHSGSRAGPALTLRNRRLIWKI